MKLMLTNAEWKLMKLLWQSAPRTVMELTAALAEETGWTKHTVITLLGRMEHKGAVRYEQRSEERRVGKECWPAVPREEAAAAEAASFLGRVFDGRLGLMVNTMVQQNGLTRSEIDELYAILKEAENK